MGMIASEWGVLPAVIDSVLSVRTRDQLGHWTHVELQKALPHLAMMCGTAHLGEREIDIRPVVCRHDEIGAHANPLHPHERMLHLLLPKWRQERKPQLFEPGIGVGHRGQAPCSFNVALHGVLDPMSGNATFFSFSRIPERLTSRHHRVLELLVPHMHAALMRILARAGERAGAPGQGRALTQRQHEILQLVSRGANNMEIAVLLHLSEHTVRHHLEHIFAKFEVKSRAQAVAKFLNDGA